MRRRPYRSGRSSCCLWPWEVSTAFLTFFSLTPASLVPVGEAVRLGSLRHYHVQQPFNEPTFEELMRLTARIFNLPLSLIA